MQCTEYKHSRGAVSCCVNSSFLSLRVMATSADLDQFPPLSPTMHQAPSTSRQAPANTPSQKARSQQTFPAGTQPTHLCTVVCLDVALADGVCCVLQRVLRQGHGIGRLHHRHLAVIEPVLAVSAAGHRHQTKGSPQPLPTRARKLHASFHEQ
jgi:hypothetical protein